MKLSNKLLLTIAFLSSFVTLSSRADTALSWNLARDMYLMTEQAPAGSPWSFMQNKTAVNASANYTLLPTFHAEECNGKPSTCWRDDVTGAYVAIPKQTFTFTGSGTSFVFKQGDVATHPGAASQSIIRWASPVSGTINVLGRVNDLHNACGDGIAWSLNLGDTVLQSGSLANGGSTTFLLNGVAVTPTSSLYLVIDKKSTNACDSTSLDMLITR
ncbi:hypothetical protein FBY06_1527 [Pseudomonas sp. SJZ085]|uniref:hypothetical protein n=1 Tax=unclassified Pseudomonas TaxID=196821 RepID=UPI001199E068|nr:MULTISPECIES: hypothetical protein [unclassified Pseudomonas]TWC11006.1 hypothetical protein FBX99_1527 [Pseudomonas sp. SJZ074]TWC29384.1 hypothetical protein FBY06_1527 [Pseudomonas sp. SJZ085]